MDLTGILIRVLLRLTPWLPGTAFKPQNLRWNRPVSDSQAFFSRVFTLVSKAVARA